MRRTAVLLVAILAIAGFAFLTIGAAVHQGITIATLLSIFIIILLGVGILGALLNPPRR